MGVYVLVLQNALAIAKQLQNDHPEMEGLQKFGMLIDILVSIFGEADITKYKPAIQLVTTTAVSVWAVLGQFGFQKKISDNVNKLIAKA